MRVFQVTQEIDLPKKLMKSELEIKVASTVFQKSTCFELVKQLQGLGGGIRVESEQKTTSEIQVVLKAPNIFSYGKITNSSTFTSGGAVCQIETMDEIISVGTYMKLMDCVRGLFYNLGAFNLAESTLRTWQNGNLKIVQEAVQFARERLLISSPFISHPSIKAEDDLSEDETEENQFQDYSFKRENIGNPMNLSFFNQAESLSCQKVSLQIPGSQTFQSEKVLRSTIEIPNLMSSSQILASFEEKTLAANKKNEERLLEVLKKLEKMGIKIDKAFFVSIKSKIDPRTPDHELLRVGLKIVKTKLRKIKRRDRKKNGKKGKEIVSESEEDDDDDDEDDDESADNKPKPKERQFLAPDANKQTKKQGAIHAQESQSEKKLQKKEPFSLLNYPKEWVEFVKSLQIVSSTNKLTLNSLSHSDQKMQDLSKAPLDLLPSQLDICDPPRPEGDLDSRLDCDLLLSQIAEMQLQSEETKKPLEADEADSDPNYRINQMSQETRDRIVAGLQARLQPE